jgi:hypothetical protein
MRHLKEVLLLLLAATSLSLSQASAGEQSPAPQKATTITGYPFIDSGNGVERLGAFAQSRGLSFAAITEGNLTLVDLDGPGATDIMRQSGLGKSEIKPFTWTGTAWANPKDAKGLGAAIKPTVPTIVVVPDDGSPFWHPSCTVTGGVCRPITIITTVSTVPRVPIDCRTAICNMPDITDATGISFPGTHFINPVLVTSITALLASGASHVIDYGPGHYMNDALVKASAKVDGNCVVGRFYLHRGCDGPWLDGKGVVHQAP